MHSISFEHLNINSIIDTLQHSVYLNICSQREIEVNCHGHQQPATNNILHATIDTIHASTIHSKQTGSSMFGSVCTGRSFVCSCVNTLSPQRPTLFLNTLSLSSAPYHTPSQSSHHKYPASFSCSSSNDAFV